MSTQQSMGWAQNIQNRQSSLYLGEKTKDRSD